jgi:5-methylcytosine-specific restriction endonuclease McrA
MLKQLPTLDNAGVDEARAEHFRTRRRSTPRTPRATYRQDDHDARRPTAQYAPAVEDELTCDFCGEPGTTDNALTFDRTRSNVVTLCESCIAVLDEELADSEDDDADDLETWNDSDE